MKHGKTTTSPLRTRKGGVTKMVKPSPRELIVVCDHAARGQVQRKQKMKKVDATSWDFDATRRNKKIHKVVEMIAAEKRKTPTRAIPVRLVTSTKGALSELKCLYERIKIEVLECPKNFTFTPLGWKHQHFYNITKPGSKTLIAQTDADKEELQIHARDVKTDIGVLKRAVKELLAKKTNDVISLNTLPGHHAGPQKMTNYCIINNTAFVARLMKKMNPRLKVGVIDIDIHPGDGTQYFVMKNPRLIDKFVSIHSSRSFWKSRMYTLPNGTKYGFGKNGIAMKKDAQGEVTVERWRGCIKRVMSRWNKANLDVIIVSLGFDTLKHDPIASPECGFQMLPADFFHVGEIFAQRPEQFFFIQEGGYDATEVASSFSHLAKGFRQERKRLEEEE